MKKRAVTMTFAWMLAMMLAAGCGKTEAPEEEAATDIEETAEPEESVEEPVQETTVEEEPVEEELTEEEPAPEEEPVEEEQAEIPPVPETDEWATNLYEALLADDYQTVLEIAPDPETVRENCAPYEDAGWSLWDYETAYRMEMSDGTVMGVILYEFEEDGTWEIDSFVSCQPGDGFEYTGYGDHQVTLYSDGGYSYIQNGNEVISESDSQSGFTMESEDDVYAVWHM